MLQEPRVPMPGTKSKLVRATSVIEDQLFGRVRPAVPMPGTISFKCKSFSDLVAITDQVLVFYFISDVLFLGKHMYLKKTKTYNK